MIKETKRGPLVLSFAIIGLLVVMWFAYAHFGSHVNETPATLPRAGEAVPPNAN